MVRDWAIGCVIGLAVMGAVARGDVLIKTDGTKLEGKVVGQDAGIVTFEANFEGLIVRQKIARGQIKSLMQEVVKGPGYCVLPMTGEVGKGITVESLRAALGMARGEEAKYVILSFDSPGGSIPEMAKILDLMHATERGGEMTLVAYIDKQAFSAAAIMAMGCRQIYMAEGTTIGAAVPYKMGPKGTPEDVEQKFLSAFRGVLRGVAEEAGHSPLFVRGMSELDVELVLRPVGNEGTKMEVAEATPGKEGAKDRIIKEKGKILTMTAGEAAESGLSAGTVVSMDEIRAGLGVKEWHRVGENATAYLENHARAVAAEEPKPGEVAARLEELTEKREELKKQLKEKEDAYDAEVAAAKAAYSKAMDEPKPLAEVDAYHQQVKDRSQAQLDEIAARYRPQLIDLETQLQTVTSEEGTLRGAAGKLGEGGGMTNEK